MKTKKIVIAVLMAALVMAFIVGCIDTIDSINPSAKKQQPTPDGKILVRLNVVNSEGRTVSPDLGDFTWPDDVNHFTLSITDSSDLLQDLPSALDGSIAGGSSGITLITSTPIPLVPEETYTFTITAFSSAASNSAVAIGIKEYEVTSTTYTLSVVLKEIVDGSGKGTFKVDGISGFDSADLTLEPLSANASSTITHDLNVDDAGAAYSGSVNSGYYKMTIELTLDGHESAYVVEVVHIYQGFTSTYDIADLPTLRPNVYSITYNFGDGSEGIPDGTPGGLGSSDPLANDTVNHGDTIHQKPITCTSTPTYIFGAWYYDNTFALATSKVISTTKIVKGGTLYAKWEPSSVDVELTGVNLDWTSGVAPDFTGSIASYNQTDDTITINIVVFNDTAFEATYEWYLDDSPTPVAGQTGSTLIIEEKLADASNWYQKGDHYVTVFATVKGKAIPESGRYKVVCNP